jgi:signal peptidase I
VCTAERLHSLPLREHVNQPDNVAGMIACDLAAEIVRTFGVLRLRVFGTSMVPSIFPGDLVSVQRSSVSEISRGEIVLYSREGRFFAHRVVACTNGPDQPLLITRGDRLDHNDPPVCSAELLGRVTSVQRGIGKDDRRLAFSVQDFGSNYLMLLALRTSDRATYLYLRLIARWRDRFPRRTKCRA